MEIPVEYKDNSGILTSHNYTMTKVAFIKHMAFAGMGMAAGPKKLRKSIGMWFHFSDFIRTEDMTDGRFSTPPDEISDPTEKGQFSNLAGKAIADFLAKRVHNTLFTVNYESAMRLRKIPVSGKRPDLIAFISPQTAFAIEAKGYTNGPRNMDDHLKQANSQVIPLNFSVASVSHHLYDQVQCNFHESISTFPLGIEDLYTELSKKYFTNLSKFLNKDFFNFEETEIAGEHFYIVDLVNPLFTEVLRNTRHFDLFVQNTVLIAKSPKLILPGKIFEWAESGLPGTIKRFLSEEVPSIVDEYIMRFIDVDRVGLEFEFR